MKNTTMAINFDLISDLYLTSMDNVTWENKATSLLCIVAGNISSDRKILVEFLTELSKYYQKVFFIDGGLEHEDNLKDFTESYRTLNESLGNIKNVIFLHENIILLPGATLLATNGWTTFDFSDNGTQEETIEFLDQRGINSEESSIKITHMAMADNHYMRNSLEICQTMADCQNIILITSSVPKVEFIKHNEDYNGTVLGDVCGNKRITSCLRGDTEVKVSTWIFGTYPGEIDSEVDGIRFVSNPGKDKELDIYFPKVIKF